MLVAEGLHARPVIHAAPVGPVRILVVEDHEVLRSGLRWLLTRVGVGGAAARWPRAARRRSRSRPRSAFDVALVDVDLGAECGLAVCERLGAHVPTSGCWPRAGTSSRCARRAAPARAA